MYKSFRCDGAGNMWYKYELNGAPFRWVQVYPVPYSQSRQEYQEFCSRDGTGSGAMNGLLKQWALIKKPALPKEDLRRLLRWGIKPCGYNVHHLVPRSFGGRIDEVDNIVLINCDLHDKLHFYLNEVPLHAWLEDFYFNPANQDKKVFLSIPILPPVVRPEDVAFVQNGVPDWQTECRWRKLIGAYLQKDSYQNAASLPLYINPNPKQVMTLEQWQQQKELEATYIVGHPPLHDVRRLCRWYQSRVSSYRPNPFYQRDR